MRIEIRTEYARYDGKRVVLGLFLACSDGSGMCKNGLFLGRFSLFTSHHAEYPLYFIKIVANLAFQNSCRRVTIGRITVSSTVRPGENEKMPRKPSVRYWESRGRWEDSEGKLHSGAYCCWFRGRQYTLAEGPDDYPAGPTYRAAVDRFSKIVVLSRAEETGSGLPIAHVCEKYLSHCHTTKRKGTCAIHRRWLSRFAAEVDPEGLAPSCFLSVQTVQDWALAHKTWASATVRTALASVKAAFRWAADTRLIEQNPIRNLKLPRVSSRGREYLTGRTPEDRRRNHAAALAAAPVFLRPFLIALEATGCRPGELMAAEAKDYDAGMGAIVYYPDGNRSAKEFAHKTSGHGVTRTIFLTGEAKAVVESQAKKHPHGKLFRTAGGKPITPSTLCNSFARLRKKLKIKHFSAYSYRHTFATEWLERGRSVDVLAALLGNSPDIIRQHYSHLLGDAANLRRQIEQFRADQGI